MTAGERVQTLHKAKDSFPYFVEHIFSQSNDIFKNKTWVGGLYIKELAEWLEKNPQTIRVSAKDHFKSMSFYAHIMWKVLRLYFTKESREINYFSYKEMMSSYHVKKIKAAIECNPFFNGVIDLKDQAEGIISYSWDGQKKVTVTPRGLMEFKRGIHCNDVYVDDALQDPENKMAPLKIKRINDIMKTQVLDMFQNECHVAGTAQTNHDFYFDKNFTTRFQVKILPAIVDRKNRIALWPEWMNFDELMAKKKERGDKVFNQEYLCSPVYSENAYIEKDNLMAVVNEKLNNHSADSWRAEVKRRQEEMKKIGKTYRPSDMVAGYDLGKKGHPGHFVVFEKMKRGRIQRVSRWFDRVDYTKQLELVQEFIEVFGIDRLYFDSTRGEFEMMEENGTLPAEMEGVHFGFKVKHSMAAALDKAISKKEIELLNDPRQIGQILIVNNDLQAPETPEGHGDSFWSVALTFMDQDADGVNISFT